MASKIFDLKAQNSINILLIFLLHLEGIANANRNFVNLSKGLEQSSGKGNKSFDVGVDLMNKTLPLQSASQVASQKSWEDAVGFWNVTSNGTRKRTCILFQAAIQFDISYTQTDGKRYIARIDLPSSADASGDCEERSQFINLTWPILLSNNTIAYASVWIFFVNYYQSVPVTVKAPSANTFAVSHIRITYPAAKLPDASNPDKILLVENKSLDNFSTPVENSYRCEFQELKSADFTIRFSDLQYQAFMRSISSDLIKFYKPIFCRPTDNDDPPSISRKDIFVALAVAGALLCIFGFLYWHKRRRGDEDEEDYDD